MSEQYLEEKKDVAQSTTTTTTTTTNSGSSSSSSNTQNDNNSSTKIELIHIVDKEAVVRQGTVKTDDNDDENSNQRRIIEYAYVGDYNNDDANNNNTHHDDDAAVDLSQKRVVLYFYPAGFNCRGILLFHPLAKQAGVVVLCVNRPGKRNTSRAAAAATSPENSKMKKSPAQCHLDTAVQDVNVVLDHLKIDQIHGILCMCAGCPFAMKFICQYGTKRMMSSSLSLSSFHFISVAGWVLPADCGWKHSKTLYTLGTSPYVPVPMSWISSGFQCMNQTMGTLIANMIPLQWINALIQKALTPNELEMYRQTWGQPVHDETNSDHDDDNDNNNKKVILNDYMEWIRQHNELDDHPEGDDVAVLLSTSTHLGIDYSEFVKQMTHHKLSWYHGTKDTVVPYASGKWLVTTHFQTTTKKKNNQTSNCNFYDLQPNGTHEGALFLMYPELWKIFQQFT